MLNTEDIYEKRKRLKQVKVDNVNWVIYYLDEVTGEKWIEEHPFGELQAGGPAQFRQIEEFPLGV